MQEEKKKTEVSHAGHRQRLRERYFTEGAENFSDLDMLEFLLFFSVPRGDTNPIAHRLLEHFGSFSSVLDAPRDVLEKVAGVGPSSALMLHLLPDVCRAYLRDIRMPSHGFFASDELMYEYIVSRFIGYDEERLLLLLLSSSGRMRYCGMIAEGGFSSVCADPRLVASVCSKFSCQRVVIAHNHPSGYTLPSREDIKQTRLLSSFLNSISIELYDHVIVADNAYESLRMDGIIVSL